MCGITGILKFQGGGQVDPALIRRMCHAMVHRGPDDEGVFTQDCVGLGMRRLSIIDVASGHQPISNEDGKIWIVFNGEIYNHAALRQQLIELGHRFKTHCDTEVIVHLYEDYGRECVQHLRGMFAFAIWDSHKRRIFVARDRLGIKPLYYLRTSESFLFGSEIKVLLAHPDARPEFHRAALPEYLAFGYLSSSETLYAGIRKLMPGHWLEVGEDGKLQVEQYWDLIVPAGKPVCEESYYVDGYRERLESSVRSHLMSDVPVGVFLSGGLDSSAIAALMTQIQRAPVETFSVGYAEQAYSELPQARLVARHLNSSHHEVLVDRQQFFDALPKLIWHEDEPLAWPSSVALYFVACLARERVTVVLTGEGSDETLAGYRRYSAMLKNAALDRIYRSLSPELVRRKIRHSIATSDWLGANLRRKLEHTFLAKDGNTWSSFYFDNFFSAFSELEQADLLSDDAAREFTQGEAYRHVIDYWERSSGGMLQRLLYTDIKTYLVELLMKQDNMSMAASIESRVPFLDHELVEFAAKIPQSMQIAGLQGKRILKRAVQDLLPHSILHREKLGFPTPWNEWLAGSQLQVIQNLLLEPRSIDRGLFKAESVVEIFHTHRSGHRDHTNRIWRLLNLELWHRICLEGDSFESVSLDHLEVGLASVAS